MGGGFCLVEEKGGLSGADFDVERCGTSENVFPIDSAVQIFGL